MSYTTGVQNYIGVPTTVSNTTSNANGQFGNLNIDFQLNPSYDATVDIGRQTKRFKKAYISEIETGSVGIINSIPVSAYEDGIRLKRTAAKQHLTPLVIQYGESGNSNDGLTACVINPYTRTLVAVGCRNSGNDFICFNTTSSIDVSDTVWTKRTISGVTMPSGAAIYYPKWLVYDPVNDCYMAFNFGNVSITSYYWCPASNLDAWETRTLSLPNGASNAGGIYGAKVFVMSGIAYTVIFSQAGNNMHYSTDNTNWYRMSNFSGIDPTRAINNMVPKDVLERPDWQEGEFDRYILLVAITGGVNTTTIWTSTSIIGPYYPAPYNINSSANVISICYNPYYRTLLMTKTATSQISVYQYYPNTNTTPTIISQFNIQSNAAFNPLQNDSYFPKQRLHLLSLQGTSLGAVATQSYVWDGLSTLRYATESTVTSVVTGYLSKQSTWAIDTTNGTAYAADRKGGAEASQPTGSSFALLKFDLFYPNRNLSSNSASVPNQTNANTENVLVSSKRIQIDKFDRLVSLTTDKITGGVGSSQQPIKSIMYNNSIRSIGRDAYIHTKGGNKDTIIDNLNMDSLVIQPLTRGKGMISYGNFKNKNWASTSFQSLTPPFTVNTSFNTRFLGSGSNTGLNRLFAISNNGTIIEVCSSIDGGLNWSPFVSFSTIDLKTAVVQNCSDIAYSPVYNTYVVTAGHDGTIFNTQVGDRCSLYSSDGGISWNFCKFETYVNTSTCYGMVKWIADWGTHGTFVMLASVLNQQTPTQSILLSEDGINWRTTGQIPSSLQTVTTGTTNRLFCKYEYDSSRNLLAVTRRNTNALTNNTITFSTDGEVWSEMNNLQAINIYTKDIVISSTTAKTNNKINFRASNTGVEYTITLTDGTYTPGALAAHIASLMTTATTGLPSVNGTYSYTTGKFNFSTLQDPLQTDTIRFMFSTGTNAASSPRDELGFGAVDGTLANIQSSSTVQYFHPSINNNRIDFLRNGSGTNRVAYLRPGNYTPSSFATEIARAINVQWTAAGFTAVTCSWSSSTGFFTLSMSAGQQMDILWSTGANNLVNFYREFGVAKADVLNTLAMTSTVKQHSDGGELRSIAYSPTLDIWVQVGTNLGAGTTGTTTSNVWWSKELGASPTSYNYGWTPVDCFQQGISTLRPSFVDVTWCDSIQMFLLLNANASYAGNVANDRNLWFSNDGKTFAPVTNSNSPKTVLSTVGALPSNRLTWDNLNHVLIIDTPGANLDVYTTAYSFKDLARSEIVTKIGHQYGVFVGTTNIPADSVSVSYTITFDTPYPINAPAYVNVTSYNTDASVNSLFYFKVLTVNTTSIVVKVTGAPGSAGGVSPPTFFWEAWESF